MRDGDAPPIGGIVKQKLSVSDVAEAFGMSRPTLYKMMDMYDRGETERLPAELVELFGYLLEPNVGAEEARMRLILMRRGASERTDTKEGSVKDAPQVMEGKIVRDEPARRQSASWSDGDIRTFTVGSGSSAMVIFDNDDPSGGDHVLRLGTTIDGEVHFFAEYTHQKGKDFFVIDDVVLRIPYLFEIVNRNPTRPASSGVQELRFR